MIQFMERRQRAILKGEMGHSRERFAIHQKKHILECQTVAKAQARANPSDTNTYNRVMSHLLNGITLCSDYLVSWAKKRRDSSLAALSQHQLASFPREITVEIPINRKIPTYC